MRNALVRTMIAPVQSEPAERSERLDEVLCGMLVEVLETAGVWSRICTEYNYTGWMANKDLITDFCAVSDWSRAEKWVVWQAHADVLSAPKVQGVPVGEVTRGALLRPLEEICDGWRKVQFCDGCEGFIHEKFLRTRRQNRNDIDEAAFRRALTDTARSYLGTQYRWGGKTPLGIDCSGLCSMAYLLNGVYICRDAQILPEFQMKKISLKSIKEGDLLFFPGHVAMYLGNGRYIHSTASNGCNGVMINSLQPGDPDFRADLPGKLLYVGSIF